MITRIEAYHYRCFPRLGVDLSGFHMLAGANGAGKTTLLDIPMLLGDLLGQQRVADAFLRPRDSIGTPRAHTLTELVHQGRGDSIMFVVEAQLPANIVNVMAHRSEASISEHLPTHARYELRLDIFNQELRVGEEYLYLFPNRERVRPQDGVAMQGAGLTGRRGRGRRSWQPILSRGEGGATVFSSETTTRGPRLPEFRIPDSQLSLGSTPADPELFPVALWLSGLLRQAAVCYHPDWASLRQAAAPGDPPRLLPSGRNLPWLARDLRQRDPDRFEFWVDHVRTALPQVRSIEAIEREEDHYAYLAVGYAGGYRVTSSGLSEGTLRILALSILPYLPASVMPRLLVTEEPENGIHPRAIETVVQSLSALTDTQVWVSTQSPIVLAETDLDNVLTARLADDGSVSVLPGREHPQLRDWHGNVDIGTLFAAGVLS